jgi:hypothetical protein
MEFMKEYLTQFGLDACFFCQLYHMFRRSLPKTHWDDWGLVSQSFNEVLTQNNIEPVEFLATYQRLHTEGAVFSRTLGWEIDEKGLLDINAACISAQELLLVYEAIQKGKSG